MANEKRLIDLDLAIERAKESDKIVKSSIWETDEVVEFLEDCPIENAVEVVHGRCAWCNGDYHTKIMATAIRYHSNGNMDGYEMKVNYCPNCGAKMDGGNEDG